MNPITIRDLCIALHVKDTSLDATITSPDFLKDVYLIRSLDQKELAKLVTFGGRTGLYTLIEDNRWGLYYAVRKGSLLTEYFIHKEANAFFKKRRSSPSLRNTAFFNMGLYAAARVGNYNLVKDFIRLGANDFNGAMGYAARGGHCSFVEYFIGEGASDWNKGMVEAARGGHWHIVDLFINMGAKQYNVAMGYAVRDNRRELVDFFISRGANDWRWGLRNAARGGHQEWVAFFIKMGANTNEDYKIGMMNAVIGNHPDLVNFFIARGGLLD